jgi:hypothetical protein
MHGFNFDDFDIKIYNIAGQLIVESKSNSIWDRYALPSDVYVYTIKRREGTNNKPNNFQGTFPLIKSVMISTQINQL